VPLVASALVPGSSASPIVRPARVLLLALLLAIVLAGTGATAVAGAAGATTQRATRRSGLLVTFAARVCPTYTSITANRARNDIQESLRDLGADTPYRPGEMVDPAVEQQHQPSCRPLPNWTFTLGTGYQTRAVSGPWGSLSIVTGAFAPPVTTQASTPLLGDQGQPTGQTIAGAATVELTPRQAELAARPSSLWAQGGTPTDPILNQPHPGQYGFGALRCAIDDLNGDNVEWIGFPSGVRHVFCFAYYVQPPPTSGTIVIRKQAQAPAGTSESFVFGGNLSFNGDGTFALNVDAGQTAEQTFIRSETRPRDPPWNVQEIVPPNWSLAGLTCVSQSGASATTTSLPAASASIDLASGDTVTCTYTDRLIPPKGGLLIRKVTHGGTGRFSFQVDPATGGGGVSAVAETHREGLAVDAQPGPLSLAPGDYKIKETPQSTRGGRWELTGAQCDGHDVPVTQPIRVSVASGAGTVCTFTNTFVQLGSIAIAKVTQGGLATTGFVISPTSGPAFELRQSATTTRQGVPAPARGEPARRLALGRYVIQETTPEPAGQGHWELTAVQCAGRYLPFAAGQALVALTNDSPALRCTFTNTHTPTPPPVPPAVSEHAELSLTKRALRSGARLGEPIAFLLTVKNNGPADAEEVVVTDQPSEPATLVSVRPSQGSCSHALPTTCLLGRIAAGHSAHVLIVLTPHQQGTFTNHAIAGTSTPDPSYARGVASARIAVGPTTSRPRIPAFTG